MNAVMDKTESLKWLKTVIGDRIVHGHVDEDRAAGTYPHDTHQLASGADSATLLESASALEITRLHYSHIGMVHHAPYRVGKGLNAKNLRSSLDPRFPRGSGVDNELNAKNLYVSVYLIGE